MNWFLSGGQLPVLQKALWLLYSVFKQAKVSEMDNNVLFYRHNVCHKSGKWWCTTPPKPFSLCLFMFVHGDVA